MTSSQIIDVEIVKKNCIHYAGIHSKAITVLKAANGVDDYRTIAKNLKMHKTRVSGILKAAERLGLASKDRGIYKKLPGILQYMPRTNPKAGSSKSISQIVQGIDSRKKQIVRAKDAISSSPYFRDYSDKMAEAYLYLFVTENAMRQLIRQVLGNDPDWWNKRVHEGIKTKVSEDISNYPYDGAKRKDELEYTHLGQLKEIITSKGNWNDFLPFLNEKDKSSFQALVDLAIPSRNSIGHCIPLTKDDLRRVDVRFKDILKTFKDPSIHSATRD